MTIALGSDLERAFDTYLAQLAPGLPPPAREVRFDSVRRWRFDRGWPDRKVAIELEGGAWQMGRHQRPQGFAADCEKYNAAVALGWRILRFTASMLENDPIGCVGLVARVYQDTTPPPIVFCEAAQIDLRARLCAVCGERTYAGHSYCPIHWQRYIRTGDPTLARKRGPKPKRRI